MISSRIGKDYSSQYRVDALKQMAQWAKISTDNIRSYAKEEADLNSRRDMYHDAQQFEDFYKLLNVMIESNSDEPVEK